MKFIFYDAEATGPEPRHDQMLHIAAVLADQELNECDCFVMRCRLLPHRLPAPVALILTARSMPDITDQALPSHYEMVSALRERLLAWSPAVFAGYSCLEFDEPLLAGAFRTCLFPPHLMQEGGNSRLDVQRLALALHSFEKGALTFVLRHDGQPSFRLSEVARANGIAHDNAHDALGDVRTTLELARLMAQRAPWLWEHMIAMGQAAQAIRFAHAAPVRLYTEFHHNRPHHWLVTALTDVPDASGELPAFDLAIDPVQGRGLDDDALRRWLLRHPKPIRPIKLAECPFVLPRERAKGVGLADGAEQDRRAAVLAQDHPYRQRLLAAHAALQQKPEREDDSAIGAVFHHKSWAERAAMSRDLPEGPLRRRAERLFFDERPDLLETPARIHLEAEQAAAMLKEQKVPWRTLSEAFDLTDAAFEHATAADTDRLEGLLAYLRAELAWAKRAVDGA